MVSICAVTSTALKRPAALLATGGMPTTADTSGATGSFQIPLDLTMTPTSVGMASVAAGETRYWQIWYRDANPTATSNFTDGVRVTFY